MLNDFSYLWSTSHLDDSYQVSSQLAFQFRRRSKKLYFKMATKVHLGFPIGTILASFHLQSPLCFLPSFKTIGLSIQKKKWKIVFQDGHHGGSWISDWNNFSFFVIYKLPQSFLPRFESISLSVQEKKWKTDLQDGCLGGWGLSWISDHNDFIFLSTSHSDASDQVIWHFGSGEEAKKRFSRWLPWWPSWNSNWKDFSYFWSTSHMMNPTKFQVNRPFDSGEANGGHLGFPIGTILAIFDLQVTPLLPTKLQVN